jgi:hypothetical protein
MKTRIIYLYIFVVFLLTGSYLFYRGTLFGVKRYKHSIHMQLALKAAYHFGYIDAKEGRKEDWENGKE